MIRNGIFNIGSQTGFGPNHVFLQSLGGANVAKTINRNIYVNALDRSMVKCKVA